MPDDSRVLRGLRQAILGGEYVPSQRLVEADLCGRFDASRFEVRAALQSLESEGLVQRAPNRGAWVREVPVEEAVEIAEIRRAVEGFVAARAAERVSDAEADDLSAIAADMRSSVADGDADAYSALNVRLHATLRAIAQHTTADRIVEQLRGQLVRHQFALSRVPGRSAVSLAQHEAIVAAVVARDPEAAEAAMRAHITSVIEAIRAVGADRE
jgi:DNA-binding GntR family transcriptional regulator